MYTFQAIADTSQIHWGFYVCAPITIIIALIMLSDVRSGFGKLGTIALAAFIVYMGFQISYGGHRPLNTEVSATFVGFQPEGYNEKSGKQHVDRHFVYVVYELTDGRQVLLKGNAGSSYPKQVTLYYNKPRGCGGCD